MEQGFSSVEIEVPPEGIASGRETWGAAGSAWIGWGVVRLTATGSPEDRLAAWDALITAARAQRWADERAIVLAALGAS